MFTFTLIIFTLCDSLACYTEVVYQNMFKHFKNWLSPFQSPKKEVSPSSDSTELELAATYMHLEEMLRSPALNNWELALAILEGQSLPLTESLYRLICDDMGRLTICIENEHIDLLRPFKTLHLQGIKADNPRFRHRFADAIGQMTHLEELYWVGRNFLFSSNYVDALPKLKNLKKLRLTQLYFNELERVICELHLLEWLDLSQNHLSDLPSAFSNLQNLQYLNLDFCYFKTIPQTVYHLENLQHLSMIGNPIDYIDIKEMHRLKKLEKLLLPPMMSKRYKTALMEFLSPSLFEHNNWKNIV